MHAPGADPLRDRRDRREAPIISGRAVRIRARWGKGLVQRQPLLRLLDAIVMELVVHPARAQRLEQIAPHILRKLAGVNGHLDRR
jgi:hypothetical protein